jgi:hypothetical protein
MEYNYDLFHGKGSLDNGNIDMFFKNSKENLKVEQ